MPLDPFLASKLDLLEGVTPERFTDPEVLARLLAFQADPGEWKAPDIEIVNRSVDGPHGTIPIRVYTPKTSSAAAVLWLHGGGFASGELDWPEAHMVASELCVRGSAVVVSVDYRLAIGGVQYPVPLDDAEAAWHWMADEYGESGLLLGLGGASAGAALALGTAVRDRDGGCSRADVLLLAYPFVHFPNPAVDAALTAEMAYFPAMLSFSVADVEGMVQNYVGRLTDLPHDALPGGADLSGLPAALIVVSEYDHLRGSAELLVRQLIQSGVPVESYLAEGMPHGHLNRTPALAEVDRSLAFLADGLRSRR